MIAGTENNLAFGEELITGKLNADTPLERDTDRYFSILEKMGVTSPARSESAEHGIFVHKTPLPPFWGFRKVSFVMGSTSLSICGFANPFIVTIKNTATSVKKRDGFIIIQSICVLF